MVNFKKSVSLFEILLHYIMASFTRLAFFNGNEIDLRPEPEWWDKGDVLPSRIPSPTGFEPQMEEERPLTPCPLTPEKKKTSKVNEKGKKGKKGLVT
jgi:hypothetical protein